MRRKSNNPITTRGHFDFGFGFVDFASGEAVCSAVSLVVYFTSSAISGVFQSFCSMSIISFLLDALIIKYVPRKAMVPPTITPGVSPSPRSTAAQTKVATG